MVTVLIVGGPWNQISRGLPALVPWRTPPYCHFTVNNKQYQHHFVINPLHGPSTTTTSTTTTTDSTTLGAQDVSRLEPRDIFLFLLKLRQYQVRTAITTVPAPQRHCQPRQPSLNGVFNLFTSFKKQRRLSRRVCRRICHFIYFSLAGFPSLFFFYCSLI